MKKFNDFFFEGLEIQSKLQRTSIWISENAENLIDFFSVIYECEVQYNNDLDGLIIFPGEKLIEINAGIEEEFLLKFSRNLLDIFPYKYNKKINEENCIIISPVNI